MKKYLAMLCALVLMTSFVSCGDNQKSNSEQSSSGSESTTEEITEPETTTEEPTTEKATELTTKYIVPELDETYEDKNIIFKYSSKWEKNEKDKINFTINDDFAIRISMIDDEHSTNDEFITAEEESLKKYNNEYEIYQSKNGSKLISYESKSTNSKKFLARALEEVLVINFDNYSSEYDEVINAIIETVQIKDAVYQKNNPRIYSETLDQTFENEDISFKYSSEWDKTIKSDEEYGYLYFELKVDPAYEFQIKISVEPITLEYLSNDEFITVEEENFKKYNEKYEIFETKSGDKFICYENIKNNKCFRAYNGKQIWIDIKNYTPKYDDIIKKIIDTVELKENFEKTTDKPIEKVTEPITKAPTVSNKASSEALKSARDYINMSGFSYENLIDQLEFEGFSHEEAVSAADNCGADWNEEALESAKSYIGMSGFLYSGLIEQLEFEKFTHEQAVYGADNCGADWNQQAADSAQSYINFMSMSRDELIEQLIFEGFTQEQAEYGASSVGY